MNSKFELQLRDAFVVSEEPLKKIHGLLAERIGTTSITAECADSVAREFEGLGALLKYENPKQKRIVTLRLYARSSDFGKSANIEFTDKWYFGGIRIAIEARDDVVTRLRSDLLDIVAGMRPWYFPLNKVDVFLAAVICYLVTWISLLVFAAMRSSDPPPPTSSYLSAKEQLALLGFLGFFFGTVYLVHRFRSILFPHGSFILGQGKTRFDTLEKWRWGFVIAFVASLVAGIALMWFQ